MLSSLSIKNGKKEKNGKKVSFRLLLGIGLIFGLISLACSEAPVNPDMLEPEGYRAYFWDEGDIPKYYSYDPVTQVLDSLSLPYRSVGAKVSPDGRLMWTLTRDGSAVVMDIRNNEVIEIYNFDGFYEIVLSPDGKYAALMGDELAIISVSDYAVAYTDTATCSKGHFTADGTGFYYLSAGVYRLNLDDSFSKVKFDIEAHDSHTVTNILPNPDESSLYLIFRSGADKLAVYKPGLDTLEDLGYLFPTCHQLALISSERFLFVTTKPRTGPHWDFPSVAYNVYDTETNEMIWEQSIRMVRSPADTIWVQPTDMVITPDNRWAIILNGVYSAAIMVLDLEKMKIEQYYEFGSGHQIHSLSCTGKRY